MSHTIRQGRPCLSKSDIQNLTCFFYNESRGLVATAFFNFPLSLKRHCVQCGVVAGQMALHVPDNAIPEAMTREEYANAVRYGCLYHDIGAYLVYNQHLLYPAAGERFLREQLGAETTLDPASLQVILEIVQFCCERYDGQGYPDKVSGNDIPLHAGICALANKVDEMISTRGWKYSSALAEATDFARSNTGSAFSPDAVGCFIAAQEDVTCLYQHWHKKPPFWDNSDIVPLNRSIDEPIG